MDSANTKKIVLIVEDDTSLRDALASRCKQSGYDVEQAENGDAGLELALKKHPDLILLDVLMPKMDGLTLLDTLRADDWGSKAKVIILSNLDATNEILNKVMSDKPSFYLLKANTSLEQIIQKVQEVIKS